MPGENLERHVGALCSLMYSRKGARSRLGALVTTRLRLPGATLAFALIHDTLRPTPISPTQG